jgi:Fe-S oxidoreductase
MGRPGSPLRGLVEKSVGIASTRVLPPYARQRFSTWFTKREQPVAEGERKNRVALFPTCLVEYQDTAIGQDLVKVYERNGVACSLPEGQRCCGAPFLHQGDVEQFRNEAATNAAVLAAAIREAAAEGDDLAIVVPQPTCSYALKNDYPDYLGGADARLVAEHTYDAAEYLMKLHAAPGEGLDTTFEGDVPESVTYHAPCHLRAQNIGLKSRDLMQLTGAKVTVVAECSAVDGTWGLREENLEASRRIARKMAVAIDEAGSDAVAGDCRLAATAIVGETGQLAGHPLQVVARAYGIDPEPGATSR